METKDRLFPCPYSIAVRCCLEDPCMGCETFGKYRVGEEVPRFDPHLQVEHESGQILSAEVELIKQIASDFFRFWWNSPGNNTDQGFDDWWKDNKQEYHSQFEKKIPFDLASHPDTEADGYVFCGKCGKMK